MTTYISEQGGNTKLREIKPKKGEPKVAGNGNHSPVL